MNGSGKITRPPSRGGWKLLGMICLALFLLAAVMEAGFRIIDPEGYAAAKAAKERQSELAKGVEDRRQAELASNDEIEAKPQSGEHCLSGWDGANRDLVRQVKATMREPDSFEHIDTRIYGNDKGEHGLWMTFRARNGFGGMNVEKIYARIDHESCNALRFGEGPGI